MGQISSKDEENIFRNGIISGFITHNVRISKTLPYLDGVNYGLIIKPLYLDVEFRLPIMLYFHGLPYHVGIICLSKDIDVIYSFCPDLREPHRGTIIKDIKKEKSMDWFRESEKCEVFWLLNNSDDNSDDLNIYDMIECRILDMLKIVDGTISLPEFNKRYTTTLKMEYNLFTNNCTHFAISILTGSTHCYQVEYIKPIIQRLLKCTDIIAKLPDFAKYWINDYKSLHGIS